MRGWMAGLIAAFLAVSPASAVIILDSTWADEGGSDKHPALGFSAAIALANQPQFAAAVAFTSDGDTYENDCSGVWIGNDTKAGYVLTAAHCFDGMARPTVYAYRTSGGSVFTGTKLFVHRKWQPGAFDLATGYDLAIVRLDRPVDDAGPQPVIYAGRREAGQVLTFVGFGGRGIASVGADDRFYEAGEGATLKAAAQGRIDEVADAVPLGDDLGNYLGIFLSKEDGSLPNPMGGPARPVSRLAGLLANGDSGSGAWMQRSDASWVLTGIASDGSGIGGYGDQAWFVRLSHHRSWIASILPTARFAEDP